MHVHILGIGGTFMSALAILARESGFKVTGSDANCYPPVSELLSDKNIQWTEGYDDVTQALASDIIIIGNAIKRGMPIVEALLKARKPYISGPQWLYENILSKRKVIAVSGTHGKTTTTSMLAHILIEAGTDSGFLIGGVAPNFNTSTKLGTGEYFVIEADEYDTAYFDKRPKFMHYSPEICIINNLEFDHADIYPNLAAIQQQFQYLLRLIPPQGMVIKPLADKNVNEVIVRGQYCAVQSISLDTDCDWTVSLKDESGSLFTVYYRGEQVGEVDWPVIGRFNVENALAAIAAAYHAGVSPNISCKALSSFKPVKRRLEVKGVFHDITVYDDFAHHPTAIAKTIEALINSKRHKKIHVILEFASNTMKMGINAELMAESLSKVDTASILEPQGFDLSKIAEHWQCEYKILPTTDAIIERVKQLAKAGDAILIMSNKGFDNIHKRIGNALSG